MLLTPEMNICVCGKCNNKKKLSLKEMVMFSDLDTVNTCDQCPLSVISAMVVSAKSLYVVKTLMMLYLMIEEGFDKYDIINLVKKFLDTLDENHKDIKLMLKLYQCEVDYEKYLDDKKFAKIYVWYISRIYGA